MGIVIPSASRKDDSVWPIRDTRRKNSFSQWVRPLVPETEVEKHEEQDQLTSSVTIQIPDDTTGLSLSNM